MGNDGFGIYLLNLLEKKLKRDDIKFIETHQLTPEIALELIEAKKTIFLDASFGESSYALASSVFENQNLTSMHNLSPKTLCKMCETLYDKEIDYLIFSVMFNEFDISLELNQKTKNIAQEMASFIEKNLDTL